MGHGSAKDLETESIDTTVLPFTAMYSNEAVQEWKRIIEVLAVSYPSNYLRRKEKGEKG